MSLKHVKKRIDSQVYSSSLITLHKILFRGSIKMWEF